MEFATPNDSFFEENVSDRGSFLRSGSSTVINHFNNFLHISSQDYHHRVFDELESSQLTQSLILQFCEYLTDLESIKSIDTIQKYLKQFFSEVQKKFPTLQLSETKEACSAFAAASKKTKLKPTFQANKKEIWGGARTELPRCAFPGKQQRTPELDHPLYSTLSPLTPDTYSKNTRYIIQEKDSDTQSTGEDAESHLPLPYYDSIDTAALLRCVEETLSKSRYKSIVKSCCIQYSIVNKSPFCCIELQHPVHSDSIPSSDEIRNFLQNDITEVNQVGLCVEYTVGFEWSENPELFSLIDSDHLWNEMSDRLADMDSTGLRSILNELTSQLMESNDCFVMFGPRYSPEKSQWTSDVTLWVCVASPWARRFLPQIYYARPQSVQSINVQYWSLTVSRQVKLSTAKPIGNLWVARDGNFFTKFFFPTSISPGQRLCIPPLALLNEDDSKDVDTPFFTLGPSLCSLSNNQESSISYNKFYITAAHSFLINNSTTTIANRRSQCYENGKSFEYCSSLGVVGSLVHIPTDSDGNITHDLALVSISSSARSSTDLLVGHKILQSSDHTDSNKLTLSVSGYNTSLGLKETTFTGARRVYKNGGTSGLSTGVIVTIGKEWIANRNDEKNAESVDNYRYNNEHHLDREYFIVKANNSTLTFSEYGDSGSPVWLAAMKDRSTNDAGEATVVGILTGSLNRLNFLSVVALLDDAVISRFFDEAGKYRR